jgi:hypothetical protein
MAGSSLITRPRTPGRQSLERAMKTIGQRLARNEVHLVAQSSFRSFDRVEWGGACVHDGQSFKASSDEEKMD